MGNRTEQPAAENPIVDLAHIVNGYRGGSYGFPSCHAANSFGLAMYVVFLFRKRWLSVFIITWAVLNCYTRIYLGVHYPGDLIVGHLVGKGYGKRDRSHIAQDYLYRTISSSLLYICNVQKYNNKD